jgi:hypothetical protein
MGLTAFPNACEVPHGAGINVCTRIETDRLSR